MCWNCWQDHGAPKLVSPTILRLAKLFRKVQDSTPNGGALRIVIEDYNLEDEHLQYCKEWVDNPKYLERVNDPFLGFKDVSRETYMQIFELAFPMSIDERASALAIADGFVTP